MQKKYLYLFTLILGTAFWGISFSLVKVGVGYSSPYVFLFYKSAIAVIALAAVFYKQLRLVNKNTVKIGIMTGIPLFIGTVLQTKGVTLTSVSNAAFLTGLNVMLIPILKFLLYKKKVQTKIWFSCIIASIGLYIVAVKDGLSVNSGDIWCIAAAFAFAFYVLQVGQYSNEEKIMPSVITMLATCALGCLVLALFDQKAVWLTTDDDFWIGVLFTAIPATAFMYAISNTAQRYIGEEGVGLAYLFEPVFAAIAGVVILNEEITLRIFIGGGLIILAMFISEYQFGRKKEVNSRMFLS